MCKARFERYEEEAEIQGVNPNGTVRLFIRHMGFIKEAKVIGNGERKHTETQAKESQS